MELARKYSEVHADLEELGKTKILNNKPTIAAVGNMLPSESSKDRYINLRLKWLEQEDSELQIMTEFKTAENKRQKAKERMENSVSHTNKSEPQLKCFTCGKKGYHAANCSKGRGAKIHVSQQQPHSSTTPQTWIPCPACNLHHSHGNIKGETMFRTRLPAYPIFRYLNISKKNYGAGEVQGVCVVPGLAW